MDIIYTIKRIFRRLLRRTVRNEVQRRGQRYVDEAASKVTRGSTGTQSDVSTGSVTGGSAGRTGVAPGAAFVGFDPLASTKQQFYVSWPAMPIETKQQMMNDSNSFGKLPEDLKQKLLAINRKTGEDANATEEEKKLIDEAFDYLAKG